MTTAQVSPPYVSTLVCGTPCWHTDFCVILKFYFTAIVKGVIALDVVCLKKWKQELLDELFCLDISIWKQVFF